MRRGDCVTPSLPSRRLTSPAIAASLAVLGALACFATPSRAWTQREFLVGLADWWGYNTDATDDSTLLGKKFRAAAAAGINLFVQPPLGANEGVPGHYRPSAWNIRTADSLGISLMAMADFDTLLTVTNPGDSWNGFFGYFFPGENGEHIPDTTAARVALLRQYHQADTSKAVSAIEINYLRIKSWVRPDGTNPAPATDRPDLWAYTFYVPGSFEYPYLDSNGHFNLPDTFEVAANPTTVMGFAYVCGAGLVPPSLGLPDPDEPSLRAMAFIPVACGARGVIWSQWVNPGEVATPEIYTTSTAFPRRSAVRGGYMATGQFWRLRRINTYLRKVVGPAIMKSDHLCTLHRSAWQSGYPEPYVPPDTPKLLPGSDKPLFKQRIDVPESLMVSIWKPKGSATSEDPAGTYYLFVVNKKLNATISGTFTMRDTMDYDVAAAPSVVGYDGQTGFESVSPGHSTSGGLNLTTFSVSLAGGEGRLYKVVPSSATADFATLTSPSGGESWTAGQSKTISWSGIVSSAEVRLYVDSPRSDYASGPYVTLAGPLSGTSCSITVPSLSSSRARIEVTGNTSSGAAARATHLTPLVIAGTSARSGVSDYSVSENAATAFGSLAVDTSGNVRLVYTGGPAEQDFQAKLWDGTSSATLPDKSPTQIGTAPMGWFGVTPAAVIDPLNNLHVAYNTLYTKRVEGDELRQIVRYGKKSGSSWEFEEVAEVGSYGDGCGIAVSDFGPMVVYNAGRLGNYYPHVALRTSDAGAWTDLGAAGYQGARCPSICIDSYQTVYVSTITRSNVLNIWWGTQEVDSYTPDVGAAGVVGPSAMQIGANDMPEVAYVAKGATTGSQILVYRNRDIAPDTWEVTFYADTVDASLKGISGVAMAHDGSKACIAYTCNGVLREAVRDSAHHWRVYDIVRNHDADAPVGFAITRGGTRWYSYWDRAAQTIRAATVSGDSTSSLSRSGGGALQAISLTSSNPVLLGRSIVFALRLNRATDFDLELYDVAGRRVASRPVQRLGAGRSRLEWQPGDVMAGMYFLRVRFDGKPVLTKRLAFLR